MTTVPLVTVYMPVFNRKSYVGEAIDSILNQSFSDFEFIIIDDGSTDGTNEVISSYKDQRIRVLSNEKNLGVRKSSNIALRAAKSKYIARMDSDDISVRTRLEKQVEFLESHSLTGVCGGHIELFGNEKEIWKYPLTNNEIKAALFWGSSVCQGTSMIKMDIIRKNNCYYNESGESFAEDWDFFYRLRDYAEFGNLNEILIKYRRHKQNMTNLLKEKSYELNSQMFQKILDDFGVSAAKPELMLHMFLNAQIEEKPDSNVVFQARKWMNHLLFQNDKMNFFSVEDFRRISEAKWSKLFFYLVPYGFSTVFSYFQNSPGIHFAQIMYFLKFSFNKFTGRK